MLQPSLPRAVRGTGIPSAVRVRFLAFRAEGDERTGNGDRSAILFNLDQTNQY